MNDKQNETSLEIWIENNEWEFLDKMLLFANLFRSMIFTT